MPIFHSPLMCFRFFSPYVNSCTTNRGVLIFSTECCLCGLVHSLLSFPLSGKVLRVWFSEWRCECDAAVSLECVNACKPWRGDGNVRFDCSLLSCAWKAPRALTGFLASTAHPHQCSNLSNGRNGRRTRYNFVSFLCFPLPFEVLVLSIFYLHLAIMDVGYWYESNWLIIFISIHIESIWLQWMFWLLIRLPVNLAKLPGMWSL